MSGRLTVVVPVHDEAGHLDATVAALAEAVERSPFHADLLVVDDGSTDGSGEVALARRGGTGPARVLRQPNRGRFGPARRAGERRGRARPPPRRPRPAPARRARLRGRAGRRRRARVERPRRGVDVRGNPFGAFGNVLVARVERLLPGAADDELRPGGVRPLPEGNDVLPRAARLLLEAFGAFSTRYADLRHANDDTTVLRALVARERIHLSPSFGCTYTPRGSLGPFLRHSLHRGVVFLDGHGRRESRFFPAVAAFYPLSALLAVAALRRPAFVPVAALATAAAAGAVAAAAGRSRFEAVSFGALAPVRVAHGGMWQGAASRSVASSGSSGVILVVFGTTGELIKLAPVLLRLDARGHRYVLATTGQQVQQIPIFLDGFGLRQLICGWDGVRADSTCGRTATSRAGSPGCSPRSRGAALRCGALRDGPGRPLVLVHGDTMTTVLGAAMGRALRAPAAHIESGLRSFDLRHPFPEELNRRLTSRIASTRYAPGRWAAGNLRRSDVVDTGSNTILDSLALVDDAPLPVQAPADEPFGVVSLHRYELLNDRALFTRTLVTLREAAERTPLLFVDHSVTAAALSRFGLDDLDDRLIRVPRLRFHDFVRVERAGAFVITDSGGSQEECFYLDRPCLVHRVRTERREGLGENVVLSGLRDTVLREFLADPSPYRRRSALPDTAPSDVIVADLERRGIAVGSRRLTRGAGARPRGALPSRSGGRTRARPLRPPLHRLLERPRDRVGERIRVGRDELGSASRASSLAFGGVGEHDR